MVNLKSLVARMNESARGSLEGAAGLCLSRTHYNVEIEHWLLRLLDDANSDVIAVTKWFEVDTDQLRADLTRSIDRFKTGNSRSPALSTGVIDLAREAWLIASLDFEAGHTRTGHLLCALLSNEALARQARGMSAELEKISTDALSREFSEITASSGEADVQLATGGSTAAPGAARGKGDGKTPSLDQFCIDMTAQADAGDIDPVLGRDTEVRQIIDILTRRRQNNPIITGEPGVGKTAVVEGFALRIATGDVPESLKNIRLLSLDLALLQAGAGIKGEFENRLKGVIDEVKGSAQPIILFIDEAHTLIGAGGQAGQGDAANILKPALARGELRTIAATTWAEYKKYIEKDAALARRFQVVKVDEPDEEVGIRIMRGLASMLEAHHNVRILDEALIESVRLSMRYIPGRQLPDKSVSVLDTACARVALSQFAIPSPIEDCRRRLDQVEVKMGILKREHAVQAIHEEALSSAEETKSALLDELQALEARWEKEKGLVGEMREVRSQLEAAVAPPPKGEEAPAALMEAEIGALRQRLEGLTTELHAEQGEEPLVQAFVDSQSIAEVIANWTGVPVGRMVSDEIETVLHLGEHLGKQVVGQGHAMEALAQSIRTSRANLTDPKRPIGVFLLVGTSGVGKTETAKALTELLYGGEQNMTVINMSEFKEEHKVSLLMGSPPGYVGYGEGGVLTEAVRRRPYSVVLLDEFEKAHPGVQDVFYRVFDEGILTDGEGRDIDFRNTVILMTTNAGTDTIMSLCADPETMPEPDKLSEALRPELLKSFKPAFLGRLTVLPYFPLADEVMKRIIELKLSKIGRRIEANYKASFEFTPDLVENILARCTEVESGARNVDHILTRTLQPELAAEFLSRMADDKAITRVRVSVDSNGAFHYDLDD